MPEINKKKGGTIAGKIIGYSGLTCYIAWNLWWLSHARVPPSMSLKLLGIPAPTTGMTRSLLALFDGRFHDSLLWNPFSVPITILFLLTLLFATRCVVRSNYNIPNSIIFAWIGLLTAAWLSKFIIGTAWW